MNVNGVILSDGALSNLRRMQEDDNAEIHTYLELLTQCEGFVIDRVFGTGNLTDSQRLDILGHLRELRIIMSTLKTKEHE